MNAIKRPRSWWPLGIVAGLGIVFVANAIMITKALENPSAPAAKDHYLESERYERVLAERRAAKALGWRIAVEACPEGLGSAGNGCPVTVTVTDRDDRPVAGLSGTVLAARADTTKLDRSGEFSPAGPGRYATTLDLADDGLYRLDLRFEGADSPWVGTREVLVRGGAAVR